MRNDIENPLLIYAEDPYPPYFDECAWCGRDICMGEEYYDDEGIHICLDCAKKYAWDQFQQYKKIAEGSNE